MNVNEFETFMKKLSEYVSVKNENKFKRTITYESLNGDDVIFYFPAINRIVITHKDLTISGDDLDIHVDFESNELYVNVFHKKEMIGDVVFKCRGVKNE